MHAMILSNQWPFFIVTLLLALTHAALTFRLKYELRNSHIPGGVYIAGVDSWRDCVDSCLLPCTAVDFDQNDLSCWHHHGHAACTVRKVYQPGVNHYRTLACLTHHHSPLSGESLASNDDDDDSLRQLATSQRSHGSLRQRHTSLRAHGQGAQLPLTCGRPVLPPSGARIVGGDESRPRSWPWQIALRNRNARSSRCAGSLIAAQWVLTTAHCVDQDLTAKNWLVLTGAHDLLALEPNRVAHTVAKVFLHPDFNLDTFDSDVALLRLNTPVTWSSTVSPVCLPPPDYEFQSTTQCIITGWGVAAGGRRPLKQASIPLVPMQVCRRRDWLGAEFTLTDRMMCAGYEHGGVDTCQGDSGGPLVCFVNNHWVQAGVTSFGRGCGLPHKPGVYAKVSKFIRWIQVVINRY